jgi:radical SAM protein with 4Fe4S-binding SPASM domain
MYTPLRHAGSIFFKTRPIHLTFFLTRKCNANCPYCFYLMSADNHESVAPELSLDEIRKISSSLGNLLWLAFSGGEIFLRKELVEISKVFYEANKPAIMLLPTNGMLPELIQDRTRQILEHCRKSVIVVKLSLDGIGDDHDVIRNTRNNFDKTMQTFHLLKEFLDVFPNFELGFNTVLNSRNQDTMEETIDYVNSLGSAITHTISMVRGNLQETGYKQVDPAKYLHAAELLESHLKNRSSSIHRFGGARLKAAQDILQRNMIHQTLVGQKKHIPCYAGKLNLVLTESGDVYPCEILPQSFGNVRDYDYDLMQVTRSEQAREIINSISGSNPHCQTCTHECNYITNILFNPAMYPSLSREYIRL